MKRLSESTYRAALVVFCLMLVFSCRKSDPDPDPVPKPKPSPWDTTTPVVFTDPRLNLMTDYEKQNNQEFASAIIQRTFAPVSMHKEGIMGVFEVLKNVYEYFEHKQEMAELNEKLNDIQGELGQIQEELQELSLQLSISTQEIMNQIQVSALQPSVTIVHNAYTDSGTINGLKYYSYNGTRYQNGQITDADMQTLVVGPNPLNPYTKQFSDNIIASGSMTNALTQFNSYLVGTTVLPSVMDGFCQWVLLKNSGHYTDSLRFFTGYELLENYFQYYLTYEFEAATVQMNADNYRDSTGVMASTFMQNTFAPIIVQQVNKFLRVVDYYVINGYDHRSSGQFSHDMNYIMSGLAPDSPAMKVLSRARFLANTYLMAVGQPYPTYCGSIILPKYNNIEKAEVPAFDVSMGGVVLTRPTAVPMVSQLPYTYWMTNGNSYTLKYGADYNWVIYHVQQIEDAGHTFSCSPQPVTIPDYGNSGTPWYHLAPIQGTVTPLYYNPQNPSQYSTTPTATCTMKYSFMAVSWRWGLMKLYLTDWHSTQLFIPDPQMVQNYQFKQLNEWTWPKLCNWPYTVSQWHSNQGKYDDYTNSYLGLLTNYPNTSMRLNFSAPSLTNTGNTWVVNSMNGFTVSTDGTPPSVNAFTSWWMTYSPLGYNSESFGFIIASGFANATSGNNNCNGTMWPLSYPDGGMFLVQKTFGASGGSLASGCEVAPVKGGNNPHIYWYYTNHAPPYYLPVNASLDVKVQYVPTGYGPLP